MNAFTKVAQWGNSLAIRLPQALVEQLAIEKGSKLELKVEGRCFSASVASAPPKYTLEEMLADITPDNLHPEFDWGEARGKEIW